MLDLHYLGFLPFARGVLFETVYAAGYGAGHEHYHTQYRQNDLASAAPRLLSAFLSLFNLFQRCRACVQIADISRVRQHAGHLVRPGHTHLAGRYFLSLYDNLLAAFFDLDRAGLG